MQIKNPSNNAIKDVRIFGVLYTIDAEGTLENVPENHARYWQENLHKFLILRKDKLEEVKEDKIEVPTPKVETVIAPSVQDVEEVKKALEIPAVTTTTEQVKEEAPVVPEKPKAKGKRIK